jgi:uncharacterized BrkB/YihY/UPF0761 family membrane protein
LIVLQSVSTYLYAGGLLPDLLVHVGMVSIFTVAAIWASRLLPHPPGLSWRDLLPGAIVFGAASRIMAVVSSVYLAGKLERVDDVYGALGTALVILLWLYLIARIMVAVPMLNSALWKRRQTEAAEADADVAQAGPSEP